ncbi:hypothetical protein L9F63_003834, partial [Diploptera punctata]
SETYDGIAILRLGIIAPSCMNPKWRAASPLLRIVEDFSLVTPGMVPSVRQYLLLRKKLSGDGAYPLHFFIYMHISSVHFYYL